MTVKNLTKQQLNQLATIRSNIQRGINYLQRPDIVGISQAIRQDQANGGDYTLNNPACNVTNRDTPLNLRNMNHHIGSDIAGLYMALTQINQFLGMEE